MTKHSIYGYALNKYEISNARPSFKKDQFLKGVSPSVYTKKHQLKTLKSLVFVVFINFLELFPKRIVVKVFIIIAVKFYLLLGWRKTIKEIH